LCRESIYLREEVHISGVRGTLSGVRGTPSGVRGTPSGVQTCVRGTPGVPRTHANHKIVSYLGELNKCFEDQSLALIIN